MSNYHITQEQANKIAVKTLSITTQRLTSLKELQAFANAVLDKVLGEPVGIIEARPKPVTGTASKQEFELVANVFTLPAGTKLYAPKELP